MSDRELVRVERDGDVALVVLQRPEARNAMNKAMATATCDAIAAGQDAACIVLTGEDPAFCAGLDLRDLGVYPGPVLVDLPRRVGEAWAREMSLTGDFVDATTALRIGIANHVVAHDELVPFALRQAHAIAQQPRDLVATMRKDWEATVGTPRREARRLHAEHAAATSTTPTGASIASHREEVIARAKASRGA